MKERSEWKPVINPAGSYTLDSRPMEGITYLERSALGVSLDSGPTEGASCLEPLEQSVLGSSLTARPVEGITEKVSDWLLAIPWTVNQGLLTWSVRRTEGASCLESLEQWVFSSPLAARCVEGVAEKVSDHKSAINPVQDITPDGRPMDGTTYPEHLAPGVSLDSGLNSPRATCTPHQPMWEFLKTYFF